MKIIIFLGHFCFIKQTCHNQIQHFGIFEVTCRSSHIRNVGDDGSRLDCRLPFLEILWSKNKIMKTVSFFFWLSTCKCHRRLCLFTCAVSSTAGCFSSRFVALPGGLDIFMWEYFFLRLFWSDESISSVNQVWSTARRKSNKRGISKKNDKFHQIPKLFKSQEIIFQPTDKWQSYHSCLSLQIQPHSH